MSTCSNRESRLTSSAKSPQPYWIIAFDFTSVFHRHVHRHRRWLAIKLCKVASCSPRIRWALALEDGRDGCGECIQADKDDGRVDEATKCALCCDGAVKEEDAELDEAQCDDIAQAIRPPRNEGSAHGAFDLGSFCLLKSDMSLHLDCPKEHDLPDFEVDWGDNGESSRLDSS
jgi:hypothetical protein